MLRTPASTACSERHEVLAPREVPLGGPRAMTVRRTLPHRDRRTVGAWCFVDHYGPDDVTGGPGMQVPPHPHTGLQTVSWLLEGEVLHRDSLGSLQLVRPGELNLMTAGHGISHSEESPADHSPRLHGVQLWTALPAASRDREPAFAHHADLPVVTAPRLEATVFMGSLDGASSPAWTATPLLGAELRLAAGGEPNLPVEADFEHAVLAVDGDVTVDGRALERGTLVFLGGGRREVGVASAAGGTALLLGGTPFTEELVMWWNFVGGSHEDVARAREQWQAADERFGTVVGYAGGRLDAPELPNTPLRPRGAVRHRP
ncbi:MAG: pirin family protein [Actinomycetes bacterium]